MNKNQIVFRKQNAYNALAVNDVRFVILSPVFVPYSIK